MTEFDLMLVGIAAVIGGAVNALAGGGTLITPGQRKTNLFPKALVLIDVM